MASVSGPETMARVLSALFAAGATLTLAAVMLTRPRGTDVVGLLAVFASAYVVAAALYAARNRVPPWGLVAALAAATGLVTAAIALTDARTPAYSLLYVWVALVAAYFMTWLHVGVQVGLIGLGYGLALLVERPPGAAVQWLISLGTLAVAALLVGMLRRAVARLIARLADSERKDAATNLLNRHGFHDLLDVELERSRRSERPVSVVAFDVDGFKAINERVGTAAGDRILVHLAETLATSIRRIDTPARVAGEEFAVVLPDTEPRSAYLLAERLRQRLAGSAGRAASLRLSAGVASSPSHGMTPDELSRAADRALAAAKTLGGDRTVLYDPQVVAELIATGGGAQLNSEESIAAVLVLAETLDIRDSGTARHSQTVGRYAAAIASQLGMSDELVERVRLAGVLHDVGKIGVSDAILRKPGPLGPDEYREMQRHSELGARILAAANLDDLSAWVLAHHERPDGRGYPRALCGAAIPLEARILAVADSYEAMTSDRVYRLALEPEVAREELRRCAGSQFDERVVEAFLSSLGAEPPVSRAVAEMPIRRGVTAKRDTEP